MNDESMNDFHWLYWDPLGILSTDGVEYEKRLRDKAFQSAPDEPEPTDDEKRWMVKKMSEYLTHEVFNPVKR